MKIAFIQSDKGDTGAHSINELIFSKLEKAGVTIRKFYPADFEFKFPAKLRGIRNILQFFSLFEKKEAILEYDILHGTTFTPFAYLDASIKVLSHFGSSTKGFLDATPVEVNEPDLKEVWNRLLVGKVVDQLDYPSRKPLEDIADIEAYTASRADAVIASSELVKQNLLSMGVEEDKIRIIYNAVEDIWFKDNSYTFDKEPHIVFVGRLGNDAFNLKLKGIDRLINICEIFKDTNKTLIGSTSDDRVTDWIKTNLKKTDVHINLSNAAIPQKLEKLTGSILFIPSRYEGFSLSLIEGMSQALVPVVYDVGVASEIIRNGENGFIVSSQEEAVEKIRLLLENREMRESCAVEAQKTSSAFTGDFMISKFLDVYKDLAKKG